MSSSVDTFITRWQKSGASERSNCSTFILELGDLLGVDRPDPAGEQNELNDYIRDLPSAAKPHPSICPRSKSPKQKCSPPDAAGQRRSRKESAPCNRSSTTSAPTPPSSARPSAANQRNAKARSGKSSKPYEPSASSMAKEYGEPSSGRLPVGRVGVPPAGMIERCA